MLKLLLPNLRPRWQFSLRGLLLITAVVAVALAIYRWPWEEVEQFNYKDNPYLVITTYHRDWQRQKVRHGSTTLKLATGEVEQRTWYVEGEVVRYCRYNLQGELVEESHCNPRNKRSVFRRGNGDVWVSRCEYADQMRDGLCEQLVDRRAGQASFTDQQRIGRFLGGIDLPKDPIRATSHWKAGREHGRTTWQTLSGELLNEAQFENDVLVTWNGQPVVQQFRDWIELRVPADHILTVLMQEKDDVWFEYPMGLGQGVRLTRPSDFGAHDHQCPLILFDGPAPKDYCLRIGGEPLAAAITEFAVRNGYCLSFRYGVLWLTPQVDAGSVFDDRTGIDRLRFTPGTPAAQAWEARAAIDATDYDGRKILLRLVQGTGIDLDLTAIGGPPEKSNEISPPVDQRLLLELPRRDCLGFLLYQMGLRCEQQGTTLIITHRWEANAWTSPIEQKPAPPIKADPNDPFGP